MNHLDWSSSTSSSLCFCWGGADTLVMDPLVALRTPMDIYPAIYIAVVRVPCPSDAERKADFGKRLHG
jgi:hypothetical protein